jgi:hypothetical protein
METSQKLIVDEPALLTATRAAIFHVQHQQALGVLFSLKLLPVGLSQAA